MTPTTSDQLLPLSSQMISLTETPSLVKETPPPIIQPGPQRVQQQLPNVITTAAAAATGGCSVTGSVSSVGVAVSSTTSKGGDSVPGGSSVGVVFSAINPATTSPVPMSVNLASSKMGVSISSTPPTAIVGSLGNSVPSCTTVAPDSPCSSNSVIDFKPPPASTSSCTCLTVDAASPAANDLQLQQLDKYMISLETIDQAVLELGPFAKDVATTDRSDLPPLNWPHHVLDKKERKKPYSPPTASRTGRKGRASGDCMSPLSSVGSPMGVEPTLKHAPQRRSAPKKKQPADNESSSINSEGPSPLSEGSKHASYQENSAVEAMLALSNVRRHPTTTITSEELTSLPTQVIGRSLSPFATMPTSIQEAPISAAHVPPKVHYPLPPLNKLAESSTNRKRTHHGSASSVRSAGTVEDSRSSYSPQALPMAQPPPLKSPAPPPPHQQQLEENVKISRHAEDKKDINPFWPVSTKSEAPPTSAGFPYPLMTLSPWNTLGGLHPTYLPSYPSLSGSRADVASSLDSFRSSVISPYYFYNHTYPFAAAGGLTTPLANQLITSSAASLQSPNVSSPLTNHPLSYNPFIAPPTLHPQYNEALKPVHKDVVQTNATPSWMMFGGGATAQFPQSNFLNANQFTAGLGVASPQLSLFPGLQPAGGITATGVLGGAASSSEIAEPKKRNVDHHSLPTDTNATPILYTPRDMVATSGRHYVPLDGGDILMSHGRKSIHPSAVYGSGPTLHDSPVASSKREKPDRRKKLKIHQINKEDFSNKTSDKSGAEKKVKKVTEWEMPPLNTHYNSTTTTGYNILAPGPSSLNNAISVAMSDPTPPTIDHRTTPYLHQQQQQQSLGAVPDSHLPTLVTMSSMDDSDPFIKVDDDDVSSEGTVSVSPEPREEEEVEEEKKSVVNTRAVPVVAVSGTMEDKQQSTPPSTAAAGGTKYNKTSFIVQEEEEKEKEESSDELQVKETEQSASIDESNGSSKSKGSDDFLEKVGDDITKGSDDENSDRKSEGLIATQGSSNTERCSNDSNETLSCALEEEEENSEMMSSGDLVDRDEGIHGATNELVPSTNNIIVSTADNNIHTMKESSPTPLPCTMNKDDITVRSGATDRTKPVSEAHTSPVTLIDNSTESLASLENQPSLPGTTATTTPSTGNTNNNTDDNNSDHLLLVEDEDYLDIGGSSIEYDEFTPEEEEEESRGMKGLSGGEGTEVKEDEEHVPISSSQPQTSSVSWNSSKDSEELSPPPTELPASTSSRVAEVVYRSSSESSKTDKSSSRVLSSSSSSSSSNSRDYSEKKLSASSRNSPKPTSKHTADHHSRRPHPLEHRLDERYLSHKQQVSRSSSSKHDIRQDISRQGSEQRLAATGRSLTPNRQTQHRLSPVNNVRGWFMEEVQPYRKSPERHHHSSKKHAHRDRANKHEDHTHYDKHRQSLPPRDDIMESGSYRSAREEHSSWSTMGGGVSAANHSNISSSGGGGVPRYIYSSVSAADQFESVRLSRKRHEDPALLMEEGAGGGGEGNSSIIAKRQKIKRPKTSSHHHHHHHHHNSSSSRQH